MSDDRILTEVISNGKRIAKVEAIVSRLDERSAGQDHRIVVLEENSRKSLWALLTAFVSILGTGALATLRFFLP